MASATMLARLPPLMKQDLRSLESPDQEVVSRLMLVWLSSTSFWLGSRVPLRTWTISRRARTNKETRSRCLRQPIGSSARSDVGKPLAYEGGSCKISSSVAVSTAGMLGRLFARRSISKGQYKPKWAVAWSQLRGSARSRDFRIRSKGQFERRQQAFRKFTHSLSVCVNFNLKKTCP